MYWSSYEYEYDGAYAMIENVSVHTNQDLGISICMGLGMCMGPGMNINMIVCMSLGMCIGLRMNMNMLGRTL